MKRRRAETVFGDPTKATVRAMKSDKRYTVVFPLYAFTLLKERIRKLKIFWLCGG